MYACNFNGQQQREIGSQKVQIKPFTSIRKELCRQFMSQQTERDAEPGTDFWTNHLLHFLTSRGQLGVTGESIKFWFQRQPEQFLAVVGNSKTAAESRTESRSGNEASSNTVDSNGNLNRNRNFHATHTQQKQPTFENVATSIPPSFQMQMPIPTPSQTQTQFPPPNSNPGLVSPERADYQQKRQDINEAFDTVRKLCDIFDRQSDLSECLLHLEKIQTICSRANTQLVFPSKHKQKHKHNISPKEQNNRKKIKHLSTDADEEDVEIEMIIANLLLFVSPAKYHINACDIHH